MRHNFILLIIFSTLLGHAVTQSTNLTFIAGVISKVPPCALDCLKSSLPLVGCTFGNATCACASGNGLPSITFGCLNDKCTQADAFTQAAICEFPYETRNPQMILTTTVTLVTSRLFVFLRLISRLSIHRRLFLDDLVVIVALVFDSILATFGLLFGVHGFGDHIWDIKPSKIETLLYELYVSEVIYVITNGLVKASLLLLYLRIFPDRKFHRYVWLAMAFVGMTTVTFTFTSSLQCIPPQKAWETNIKDGHCLKSNAVVWAHAGFSVAADLIIFVLPATRLHNLQMSIWKKAGIFFAFALGSFVCIATIARMTKLPGFGYGPDPTFDSIPVLIWSAVETCAAFVCACLPAIRAGMVRLFPKIWTAFVNTTGLSFSLLGGSSRAAESPKDTRPNDAMERSGSKAKPKFAMRGPSELTNILASIDGDSEHDTTTEKELGFGPDGSVGTLVTTVDTSPPNFEKTLPPSPPRSAYRDLHITESRREYQSRKNSKDTFRDDSKV